MGVESAGWGPALKILLIRFPNLRSHCPARIIAKQLRIRPYSKYLKFGLGVPGVIARFDDSSA